MARISASCLACCDSAPDVCGCVRRRGTPGGYQLLEGHRPRRDRSQDKFLTPHKKNRELRSKRVAKWPEPVVRCLTTRPKPMRRHFDLTEHQDARCRGNKRLIERSFSHGAVWLPIGCEPHLFASQDRTTAAKAATTPADRCSVRQGGRGHAPNQQKGK